MMNQSTASIVPTQCTDVPMDQSLQMLRGWSQVGRLRLSSPPGASIALIWIALHSD
jgi:hypothetical protein